MPTLPPAKRGGRASTPTVQCPSCGNSRTKALVVRNAPNNAIRRRRQCSQCHGKFTTYETYVGLATRAESPNIVEVKRLTKEAWALLAQAIQKFPNLGTHDLGPVRDTDDPQEGLRQL